MRITLWIVSQQSIPFFTTYKMIRLFSLFPFVTSRWWSAPVKFVRKSFITLRNLDGALYRSHCEAFISFWSYYHRYRWKNLYIFPRFHSLFISAPPLVPSNLATLILHRRVFISFSPLFIALYFLRLLPSSLSSFHKFKLITLHDVSLYLILRFIPSSS